MKRLDGIWISRHRSKDGPVTFKFANRIFILGFPRIIIQETIFNLRSSLPVPNFQNLQPTKITHKLSKTSPVSKSSELHFWRSYGAAGCCWLLSTQGLPTRHCPDFPAQWGVVNDWSDLEKARCLDQKKKQAPRVASLIGLRWFGGITCTVYPYICGEVFFGRSLDDSSSFHAEVMALFFWVFRKPWNNLKQKFEKVLWSIG